MEKVAPWKSFAVAFKAFHEVMDGDPLDPIVRDAAIKRFEYTYETAWRAMRRAVGEHSGEEPRRLPLHEIFRIAAALGWIEDPRAWFEYKEWRNETTHLCDEDKARVVFNRLGRFRDDAGFLLARLQSAFPQP